LVEAPAKIEDAWKTNCISGRNAHLALAEAVSPMMSVEARLHLNDPEVAAAAGLHLATIRAPELPTLLSSMLVSRNPQLSLLANRLLAEHDRTIEGTFKALLSLDMHPVQRRRLARSLRAYDPEEVLFEFQAQVEEEAREHLWECCAIALQIGTAEMQDAALEAAAKHAPNTIKKTLRAAHTDTPLLRQYAEKWIRHDVDRVAEAAIRTLAHVRGVAFLIDLDWLRTSRRAVHRLEWARAVQNTWRNHRDAKSGLSALPHKHQRELAKSLRTLIHDDADNGVRKIALYTAGNIGLSELAGDLVRCAKTATDGVLRQAATTSLVQFTSPRRIKDLLELLRAEQEPIVVFRLVRALLKSLEENTSPQSEIASLLLARYETFDPPSRVLALGVLGHCRDLSALSLLKNGAQAEAHTEACASLTALGRLGSEKGLMEVLKATYSHNTERRLRATLALEGIGGAVAKDCLVDLVTSRDEDEAVRRQALGVLKRCVLDSARAAKLVPADIDDPLVVQILDLRRQHLSDATARDVDTSLEENIADFRISLLEKRKPEVLAALRTAEFFTLPDAQLPEGFDPSPPILYWVKGLEVWLNDILGGHLRDLANSGKLSGFEGLSYTWSRMRRELAPGWKDQLLEHGELFASLVGGLRNLKPGDVRRGNLSLRPLAAALLVCGERDGSVDHWKFSLSRSRVVELVNQLAALIEERNQVTHRRAGIVDVNREVRSLALSCLSMMTAMTVGPAVSEPRRRVLR
ncbi:MAG: HEAT repeat domain-containing protein, partial [Proteobacteria bacterium]|nr:HEAT repeat domain-containing protein [Pseudomonadota bacterium]